MNNTDGWWTVITSEGRFNTTDEQHAKEIIEEDGNGTYFWEDGRDPFKK